MRFLQNDYNGACLTALQSERRWLCLAPDSLMLDQAGHCSYSTRFPYPVFHDNLVTLTTVDLGLYFSNYLKLYPFNFGNFWSKVGTLLEEYPDRSDAGSLLNWVLSTFVVRNRSEDVHCKVILPPLTKRTVHLDCGHHELHCYNFLLAQVIAYTVWNAYKRAANILGCHKDFGPDQHNDAHKERCCLWPTPSIYGSRGKLVRTTYDIVKKGLAEPRKYGLYRTEIDLFRQCLYWMELGKRYECYRPYNYHYGVHYYVNPWPKSSPVSLGTREKLDLILLRKLPGNDETDAEPGTKGKPLCFSLNISAMLLDDEKVYDWAE
ncbi:hypothetical protein IWQ61_004158 [Dispira simplex]|nr:hypothetical protein IWQ61_004158 [Dispira simplex]